MVEFRTNVIKRIEDNKDLTELPPMPFVVMVAETGYTYMITRFKTRFVSTGLEDGVTYDLNYNDTFILHAINDGRWILKKSNIEII